jgi:hypothetical protein
MTETAEPHLDGLADTDIERGVQAAHLIWMTILTQKKIVGPRTPAFARVVIDELAASLAASPGSVKRMMRNAAQGAADLNVSQFQGLVEIS